MSDTDDDRNCATPTAPPVGRQDILRGSQKTAPIKLNLLEKAPGRCLSRESTPTLSPISSPERDNISAQAAHPASPPASASNPSRHTRKIMTLNDPSLHISTRSHRSLSPTRSKRASRSPIGKTAFDLSTYFIREVSNIILALNNSYERIRRVPTSKRAVQLP